MSKLTTSRRGIGKAFAIGTATTALAMTNGRLAFAQQQPRTFVLIHGAWHGGWCWRRVSDSLERLGHKVYTPTLTGVGERSHLLTKDISLQTHLDDVANLIKWERLNNIVLVAHSYAGIVASALASQIGSAIGSLILLDAFYPKAGEGLTSMAAQSKARIEDAMGKGAISVPPTPSANFNVNENDRAWVDSLCTPHPIRTFVDPVASIDARERISQKTYIRARDYKSDAFDAALSATRSDRSWETFILPGGHDLMVDSPDPLVELLIRRA